MIPAVVIGELGQCIWCRFQGYHVALHEYNKISLKKHISSTRGESPHTCGTMVCFSLSLSFVSRRMPSKPSLIKKVEKGFELSYKASISPSITNIIFRR